LFVVAFVAGCSGGACTDNVEPGFVIAVYDKQSMEPLCGANAMLMDGEYVESKTSPVSQACTEDDARIYMAFEREGSYQIIVSAEGYETWTSDEIAVISDECHVIRNNINVFLD